LHRRTENFSGLCSYRHGTIGTLELSFRIKGLRKNNPVLVLEQMEQSARCLVFDCFFRLSLHPAAEAVWGVVADHSFFP